jgi:hypothetical protein
MRAQIIDRPSAFSRDSDSTRFVVLKDRLAQVEN